MSYQNLIMYFKTIPSYDSEDEKSKDSNGVTEDESVDIADLGSWITNTRANNRKR